MKVERPCTMLNVAPSTAGVREATPVLLNVYDAGRQRCVRIFNRVAHHFGAGAYHVGIQVHDLEWSYGYSNNGSGISAARACMHPFHRFRGSIFLGSTLLSADEARVILLDLSRSWFGAEYHILTRNCVHFAHELVSRLGVGPLPSFVDRLARLGNVVISPFDIGLHAVGSFAASKSSHSSCSVQDFRVCQSSCSLHGLPEGRPPISSTAQNAPASSRWISVCRRASPGSGTSRRRVLPWHGLMNAAVQLKNPSASRDCFDSVSPSASTGISN